MSYLVTVVLETTAPSIKPGMTALVDIVTDRKQNALVIPIQAIRRMGRARVVEVQQQRETTTVPVQVGV